MPNGYETYLEYKRETRKIEREFLKLFLKLLRKNKKKAEEILGKIIDPDDPLTMEDAIKIIKEYLKQNIKLS